MADVFELANTGAATPAELGYYFPAEFAPQESMWLSWPHNPATWPGKIEAVYAGYARFVKEVAGGQSVNINVSGDQMESFARAHLQKVEAKLDHITFHHIPTNDAWCRDHGPAFLINPQAEQKKVLVNWGYNAWGDKYPPYDLDNKVPVKVANYLNLPCFHPGIIMEGGSVEFNGKGTLLTSEACLLNKNRNPHLNQAQIERYLQDFYGVNHILWVGDGIVGDDTDGHIDDITRFVNADTVVTVVEENSADENYSILQENLSLLKKMRLEDGKQLNIVELPMPSPVVYEGQRLPASYANFYIANESLIVPTFRDKNDQKALDILTDCFPTRRIVGIDSTDIIWGLGSFHCLSQQEPAV